jgi:cob(I)alamin adenosyltransferase
MKIYTKTGDRGQTGLFGGARVSKSDGRVDAYGEVDELNSALGVARAHGADSKVDALLQRIQNELFTLGAELATAPGKTADASIGLLGDGDVEALERAIDEAERELPALRAFVLPGGSKEAAFLHLARTTCRRAERKLVALSETTRVRGEVLRYVNRLSDLLFVLARHANFRAKVPDVPWLGRKSDP